MNKNKYFYFLMGLVPCKLLAFSVPLQEATIVANPEVQSTSLWWYFVFILSFILGFVFCFKSVKEFSRENYPSAFISLALTVIAEITFIVAHIFI